jgi:hypothetical protein
MVSIVMMVRGVSLFQTCPACTLALPSVVSPEYAVLRSPGEGNAMASAKGGGQCYSAKDDVAPRRSHMLVGKMCVTGREG